MNLNEIYARDIESIFAEAAEQTALFPAPLNEIGLALLAGVNPLQHSAGTNYITFLLPVWLQDQTLSSRDLSRDLAVGNVFAMMHFFLLDDVMDAGAESKKVNIRETLALGQLFQSMFQMYYSRHFMPHSPLWTYYRSYLEAWASAVSEEGKIPADPHDPKQLARKSAPVKLCAAGMLLLAGQEAGIPGLEEAIDLVLATLQLSDDWADWREDLPEESGNVFLTLARHTISLPPDQPLDERKVKQAIYRANALGRLADIARDYGERLKRIPHVPASLAAFQEVMFEGMRQDADKAEETSMELAAEGGLFYFLSKNAIK